MRTTSAQRATRTIQVWVALGMLGFVLLPWYFVQRGSLWSALPSVWSNADYGSGVVQAWQFHKPWLWVAPVGLLIAAAGCCTQRIRLQGQALTLGAGLGLAGLLLSSFGIGVMGWNVESLQQLWPLEQGQYGMGWGGMLCVTALTILLGAGVARLGYFKGDVFVAAAVLACAGLMALFVVYPVGRALASGFVGEDGQWAVQALTQRIGTERIWGLACLQGSGRCGVAWNTLALALMTALGTTVMGTLMALMAERGSNRRLQQPLNVLAMLPIITPPFVVGLGLILLFGRSGVVNQWLEWAFGITPSRWFYGVFGVWLAQLFAFTPIAFMIMRGVVQGISPSLEEAAQTLRASPMRTFMTVTLPLLAPGLANAFLVGFIESIADFGNPIVLGSGFAVLSTEVFFAIVGSSLDPGMAAALAWILTLFALVVFFVQRRLLGKSNFTTVSGKGDAGIAMPLPRGVRIACQSLVLPWLLFTVVLYAFAFMGGFVRTWGRDYTLTLAHFQTAFDIQWGVGGLVWAGTAWQSLFNTVALAAIAAPLCAALGLLIAWLLARIEFRGRATFEFSALLTFAIPGTVLGMSYILAFNVPPVELTGTGLIIVLCFVFRNLPVGVRAGTATFKQLDRSLDEASVMLGANSTTTLRRVVLPLIKPALVASLIYSFVRSMTTVSAVIFLVTAEYDLATTYIIGRVGTGDYGVALAYCTVLIVLMSMATGAIQLLVGKRQLGRRSGTNTSAH